MSEYTDTLDLTGSNPDEIGFPAIPSGRYAAHVAKASRKETDNIDGSKALPHGTPYYSLGIRVNEDHPEVEDAEGNSVAVGGAYAGWINLFFVPADYDPQKARRMKNQFANFLRAAGEEYEKKGYSIPPADDFIGREVTVIVRRKWDRNESKWVNEIEGFAAAGDTADASGMLR